MSPEQAGRIERHERASAAWDRAWDDARDEDRRLGRAYDRRLYAEKAHAASAVVLGECRAAVCSCQVALEKAMTSGEVD